jgi:hypothetical protein
MDPSYLVDSEKGDLEPPSYTPSAQPARRDHAQTTLSIVESARSPTEPVRIDSSAKIPVEFRTLRFVLCSLVFLESKVLTFSHSIHVTDTKEGKEQGAKKGVVGLSFIQSIYSFQLLSLRRTLESRMARLV